MAPGFPNIRTTQQNYTAFRPLTPSSLPNQPSGSIASNQPAPAFTPGTTKPTVASNYVMQVGIGVAALVLTGGIWWLAKRKAPVKPAQVKAALSSASNPTPAPVSAAANTANTANPKPVSKPVKPPNPPSRQMSKRPTPPEKPTASVKTEPLGTLMTTEELFGKDLKKARYKQKAGTNTCYLISAFDSIRWHPHGKKILDQIKIYRQADGYRVKFPAQKEPVHVSTSELNGETPIYGKRGCSGGVQSDALGIRLIEKAYLKLDDVQRLIKRRGEEQDDVWEGLQRIFGDTLDRDWNDKLQFEIKPVDELHQSWIESIDPDPNHANIWAAVQRLGYTPNGHPQTGSHFFSIRINPDPTNPFQVVNPLHPTSSRRSFASPSQLMDEYQTQAVRIRLR